MPISAAFKRIARWASNPGADRTDPDDAALTPPLDVADGWPASFSQASGNTPRRAVINEVFHRITSALVDIRQTGVLPWDADVDTLQDGVRQRSGRLFRATVNIGPAYGNQVDPLTVGQTLWAEVTGTLSAPAAPTAPAGVAASPGVLVWTWNCPSDGGAQISGFEFEWRPVGDAVWRATGSVTVTRFVLSGLPNGAAVEARVRASNSRGAGPYSAVGTATPQASVPGGGGSMALRAFAGDASGEVDLSWLEPDTGGSAITGFTVQWRVEGQVFSSSRQRVVVDPAVTLTGLVDDTAYFFQVFATNSVGDGLPSNVVSATPVAPPAPPPPPDPDTAPDAPAQPSGTVSGLRQVRFEWNSPDQNGQPIVRYEYQVRASGGAWPSDVEMTTATCAVVTAPSTTAGVAIRVRAVNSVGTSGWSPTGEIPNADLNAGHPQPGPVRNLSLTSQTLNWDSPNTGGAVDRFAVVRFNSAGDYVDVRLHPPIVTSSPVIPIAHASVVVAAVNEHGFGPSETLTIT